MHAVGRLLPITGEALNGLDEPHWPILGAYLLGLWGLPHPIIEAIAYHQKPQSVPHDSFELVDLIHVAHHLAKEIPPAQAAAGMNKEHLRSIGYDEKKLEEMIDSVRRFLDGDARDPGHAGRTK